MTFNDDGLNGWEERSPQDGHNQSCTCYLDILTDAAQCQPVDGGEHQRQTDAHRHQTVDAVAVGQEDDTHQRRDAQYRHRRQHTLRREPVHEPGADKAAAGKENDGYDVELLRQHLRLLFRHPLGNKDTRAVDDDIHPAGSLRTHVEELGQDTLTVVLAMPQFR